MAAGLNSLEVGGLAAQSGDDGVQVVGDDGAISVSVEDVAVSAVPVLGVTDVVATGSHSVKVLGVGGAGGSDLHVLDVGQNGQSLVGPNLLALVADPVLHVTVLGAGGSLGSDVLGRILQSGDNQVLVVGHDGALGISVEHIAVSAVPVSIHTGVVAAGLDSLVSLSAVLARGSDLNVLQVGQLSQSLVSPNLLALGAGPVLHVTVLGAGGSLGSDVVGRILQSGQNHVLDVGDLGQSLVGPHGLAIVADPVLNVTDVVATGGNSVKVHQVGVLNRGQDHALGVGDLGQSGVSPELLAIGAVPVLDVTGLEAGGLNSLNVLQVVGAGGAQDHALGVGDLGQSLISPELLALVADPVLDVTIVVATGSDSLDVSHVAAQHGQDHALGVGDLSQSLVSPEGLAIGAEPVLDVTDVVAAGINSVEVNGVVLGSSNLHVLDVGQLGQSLVGPNLLALGAIPVLDVTLGLAGGLHSGNVGSGGLQSGNDDVLDVGNLGQSLVDPNLLAIVADPVLNVTIVVATGSHSVEVSHVAALSGNDGAQVVGHLSQSLVGPEALALIAVPVLDVTDVVATGLHSVKVENALGVDGTDVATQVTGSITISVILMLTGGLTDHGDRTVDNGKLDSLTGNVEEVAGLVHHGQRIGAGRGIVLHLEGSGEEVLFGDVLRSNTIAEVHEALAQRAPRNILGAPALGRLNLVHLDVFVHVLVIDPLGNELQHAGIVIQLNQGGDNTGVVLQLDQHVDSLTGVGGQVGHHNGGLGRDRLVASNGNRTVDNGKLDGLTGNVEEVAGLVHHGQRIGAGRGIVLHLEGSGEEVLFGDVLRSNTIAEVHEALAQRAPRNILGAPALGRLNLVHLDIFVHVLVIDHLGDEFQHAGIVLQLYQSGDNTGIVLQLDLHLDGIAGLSLHVGNHNRGLLSSGGNGERNRGTNQKNRKKNC